VIAQSPRTLYPSSDPIAEFWSNNRFLWFDQTTFFSTPARGVRSLMLTQSFVDLCLVHSSGVEGVLWGCSMAPSSPTSPIRSSCRLCIDVRITVRQIYIVKMIQPLFSVRCDPRIRDFNHSLQPAYLPPLACRSGFKGLRQPRK
jgi:hypothetical protein